MDCPWHVFEEILFGWLCQKSLANCTEILQSYANHEKLSSFDYMYRFSRIREKIKEIEGHLPSDYQSLLINPMAHKAAIITARGCLLPEHAVGCRDKVCEASSLF